MPRVWYPAQKNPTLPATNQRQGREIYPDGIERVGIRANVHPLMEAEERRLNRQLTARMLVDGVGDKAAVTNTGKVADGHE